MQVHCECGRRHSKPPRLPGLLACDLRRSPPCNGSRSSATASSVCSADGRASRPTYLPNSLVNTVCIPSNDSCRTILLTVCIVGMISIGQLFMSPLIYARSQLTPLGARFLGGVIGTGLFLGSAVRGPSIGTDILSDLISSIIGRSAQWRPHRSLARIYDSRKCGILPMRFDRGDVSLLVSSSTLVIRNSADIPSLSPNVGGVIGLADLYVDPALGFSLGWAAWVSHASYVISVEAHTD